MSKERNGKNDSSPSGGMFRKASEDSQPPRISFLMEKNGRKPAVL